MEQEIEQYIQENFGQIIDKSKIPDFVKDLAEDAITIFIAQTNLFFNENVEIVFVQKVGNQPCHYVESSYLKPILLVDKEVVYELCDKTKTPIKLVIYVSIFHELIKAALDLDTKKGYCYFADNFENLETNEGIEEFIEQNTIHFWEKGKPTNLFLNSCDDIVFHETKYDYDY